MHARRLAVLAFTIVTLSCSEPPDKERQQAADAIAAARAQKAATYAPEDLAAAERSLAGYDTAVAQRDYRLALSQAIDARDQAYTASRAAAARMVEAKASAGQLLKESESAIDSMRRRLAVTGKNRLSPGSANRLRAAITAAEPTLRQSRTALERDDFRAAATLLTPLLQTLRQAIADADARPVARNP